MYDFLPAEFGASKMFPSELDAEKHPWLKMEISSGFDNSASISQYDSELRRMVRMLDDIRAQDQASNQTPNQALIQELNLAKVQAKVQDMDNYSFMLCQAYDVALRLMELMWHQLCLKYCAYYQIDTTGIQDNYLAVLRCANVHHLYVLLADEKRKVPSSCYGRGSCQTYYTSKATCECGWKHQWSVKEEDLRFIKKFNPLSEDPVGEAHSY